ncbi:MAG: dTDP-4-dehydrorhamnose reductase [Eubacteriales bacterium]|nr:dTDP-4-dehydrorhamnose reductase [Eubacteriales bacterium]
MSYIRKIWISGANGRLGQELVRFLDPMDAEILATDKEEVDITDAEAVMNFAERFRPQIIINCAGMTDPEACEKAPETAFLVNGLGARNMAIAAQRIQAKMVQLSTDDVFDGDVERKAFREFDTPNPSTMYGKSKLFGEQYTRDFCNRYFILRSSWLYGTAEDRVEHILSQARNNGQVLVAKEQYACPTSARQLARFIAYLIQTNEYGTYHAVCTGIASRADFARAVLQRAGLDVPVEEREEVFNAVYRPDYSVLENFLLRVGNLYEFPTWEEDLTDYMKEVYGDR